MSDFDTRLAQLREKMAEKQRLEATERELLTQQRDLNSHVWDLRHAMEAEQEDVDKLEGRSLAVFFYKVVGQLDGKLDKEREEAYAARVKHDSAARELMDVEAELRACRESLSPLRGVELEYERTLREKQAAIKAAGGEAGERIEELEKQLTFLTSHRRELNEAISAGERARSTANRIQESLKKAENWGTYDLLTNNSLISHMAKHEHLDNAQHEVELLQSQLRRFKTELADVSIRADMQVNIQGFTRFADFFFDGLIVDWTVLKRIQNSQAQVSDTQSKLSTTLMRLRSMLRDTEREERHLTEELRRLVAETAM